MVYIRINDVIQNAKRQGIQISKKELAKEMWSNTENTDSRKANLSALCRGKTKQIRIEWVETICKLCHCSPNELFGYKQGIFF